MNTMINVIFWQSRKNDDRHMNDDLKVDRFATTAHVETVVCLSNKNAKQKDYVEIGVDAEDYYRIKENQTK